MPAKMSPQEMAKMVRIFDSLKSKQKILVAMTSVMGMSKLTGGGYHEWIVGRRSTSKKYGVTTITLLQPGGPKPTKYNRFALMKRKNRIGETYQKDGSWYQAEPTGFNITAAHGDMAMILHGIKRPGAASKGEAVEEAMRSMNVAAYMRVGTGPLARPRTMLDFNQWDEVEEEDEAEPPFLPRTGVWSGHGPPTFREGRDTDKADSEQRAQLEDMGVEIVSRHDNGYFDLDADPVLGAALFESKKLGKVPKKWKAKTGKKEVELGLKLATQGLIGSKDPKEIRWAQKLYAFAHGVKGSGVSWWATAEKAEKALAAWLKKHGHPVPKMVGNAWVIEDEEAVGASVLREGKKRKLHPSMLKHVGSKKFKAHVGDPKDEKKPYHKGKGIQSDTRVSAAVLRESRPLAEATFKQAMSDLMTGLEKLGWKVASRLKVPHATSPDGGTRIWFKAQAVYAGPARGGMRDARSLHVDAKRATPDGLAADAVEHAKFLATL